MFISANFNLMLYGTFFSFKGGREKISKLKAINFISLNPLKKQGVKVET